MLYYESKKTKLFYSVTKTLTHTHEHTHTSTDMHAYTNTPSVSQKAKGSYDDGKL